MIGGEVKSEPKMSSKPTMLSDDGTSTPAPRQARSTHDTPRGRIEVTWRRTGTAVELVATVPPETTATVELPLHATGETHPVGAGTHLWTYVTPDGQPALTLDTPVGTLAIDATNWARITAILRHHLSPDALVERHAATPLSTALNDYSVVSAETRAQLTATIERRWSPECDAHRLKPFIRGPTCSRVVAVVHITNS